MSDPRQAGAGGGFRDKVIAAVAWTAAFGVFRDLLQFVTMMVLVRLVAPEAYGQAAVAHGVIGFLGVFSFTTLVSHALQARSDRQVDFQQHFTFGALLQPLWFAATNLLAVALRGSDTYGSTAPLLHVLSIGFLLDWPAELRRKMIEREMDWRRLRLLHAIGLVVAAVLAVAMALAGQGVYALVVPGLAASLPFVWDLFGPLGWRPTWKRPTAQFRPALRFGATRAASGVSTQGRQLLETAGLAPLVGFESLAFFGRAVGLANLFCVRAASQLMQALYPVLTRIEEGSPRYQRASALVLRAAAWVVLPVATVFAALARPVVELVYGSRWSAVVPLLPWVMAAGAAGALAQVGYQLLLAHNRERRCLTLDILALGGTLAGLALVAAHGLLPYIALAGLVQLASLVLALVWLGRLGAATAAGISVALMPSLAAVAAGAAVCRALFGPLAEISRGGAFLWAGSFGALYLVVLRFAFRGPLAELVGYLPFGDRLAPLLLLGRRR